ncbi:MAG: hypothetical protein ABFD94_06100 [Armatimonadia bacterium]
MSFFSLNIARGTMGTVQLKPVECIDALLTDGDIKDDPEKPLWLKGECRINQTDFHVDAVRCHVTAESELVADLPVFNSHIDAVNTITGGGPPMLTDIGGAMYLVTIVPFSH